MSEFLDYIRTQEEECSELWKGLKERLKETDPKSYNILLQTLLRIKLEQNYNNIPTCETDLCAQIKENLHENVNKPQFKRLKAAKSGITEADLHFYTEVFHPSILQELSKYSGCEYYSWNEYKGNLQVGGSIGFRWCFNIEEWKEKGKQTRNKDKEIWRPQIIATIRPEHIWEKWRYNKEYCSVNGKTGQFTQFKEKPIMEDPEWEKAEIVPLVVTLPIKALTGNSGIKTIKESRYHNDDDGIDLNQILEIAKKDEEDQKKYETLCRKLYSKYKGEKW